MKKIILFFLLLSSMSSFAQMGVYHLKGQIGHFNAPVKVYARYMVNDEKIVIDSSLVHDGNFDITGKIDGEREVYLLIDYSGKGLNQYKMTKDVFVMYLEKGTANVFSKDSLNHSVVSNSPINEEYNRYKALYADESAYISKNIKVYFALQQVKNPDTVLINRYERKLDSADAHRAVTMKKYIAENPDSYFSLVSIKNLDPYNDLDKSLPLFNQLSDRIKNTPVGKEIQASFAINSRIAEGKMAPDFTLSDAENKQVSLSSFKGHYVLLDFWASWCAPCRAETPNVVKAFNKYKDRNFTVFSVSIDVKSDHQAWLDAIKKDGMTWTNGITPTNYKSPELLPYNLLAVPKNFLIDPSGKIIGHDLRGKDLEDKLAQVLKTNQ